MRRFIILLALAAVATLAFAGQTLSPAPAATDVPMPPSMIPKASTAPPSPAPSATPLPIITPRALPSSLPTPLVLPPDAPPQILTVTMNEPVFHSGDIIASTVITSTNVAAVELRVAGRMVRFPRIAFGVWKLSYRLPHIPRRMLRDYPGEIVALNSAGIATVDPITISLR